MTTRIPAPTHALRPLTLVAPLLLAACVDITHVRGNGDLTTETREVEDFTSVSADNLVHVVIEKGPLEPVQLTCDSNLMEHIEVEVVGRVLHVKTRGLKPLTTSSDCEALVTAPRFEFLSSTGSGGLETEAILVDLESVTNTGSGAIEIAGADTSDLGIRGTGSGGTFLDWIEADAVEVESTGSGGIVVAGEAIEALFRSTGSGGIDAADLHVQHAEVQVTGSGSVSLFASESVEAFTSGSGGVDVFGDPAIRSETSSGSGSVRYR